MQTIITRVRLHEGGVEQWDNAMRERIRAAAGRPGWVSAQLLRADGEPLERTIVGVWESVADWQAWHQSSSFRESRELLDSLEDGPNDSTWYDTLEPGR